MLFYSKRMSDNTSDCVLSRKLLTLIAKKNYMITVWFNPNSRKGKISRKEKGIK